MKQYDYVIVGSGLFGSVFAHEMNKIGRKCLVIEKRNHIAGNIYTGEMEGINIHFYGAHIFHTNDKYIWEYVNQFSEFNNYVNSPMAIYKNEIYNLPFNMNTFSKMWDIKTPEEARAIIDKQINEFSVVEPTNLEEQAIKLVGIDIYEKLIKGYTQKQWGVHPKELPSFIIKRLPVRFTYNNNYFNDRYQGIPVQGYTKMVENMLKGIEVWLNYDFFTNKEHINQIAKKIIYTGPIDQYFNFVYGPLEYRGLRFEHQVINMGNYQGNAVINYTDSEIPYTRIIEHKHFEFGSQPKTVITKEYSIDWKLGDDPYYPINNMKSNTIYDKYKVLAESQNNVIFGGRLAEYKYYDMHNVIKSALDKVKEELNEI
jgi:UDP-galactopyranose mutase